MLSCLFRFFRPLCKREDTPPAASAASASAESVDDSVESLSEISCAKKCTVSNKKIQVNIKPTKPKMRSRGIQTALEDTEDSSEQSSEGSDFEIAQPQEEPPPLSDSFVRPDKRKAVKEHKIRFKTAQ